MLAGRVRTRCAVVVVGVEGETDGKVIGSINVTVRCLAALKAVEAEMRAGGGDTGNTSG